MLWYEPARDGALTDRAKILTCAGGCLSELRIGDPAPDGPSAIQAAIQGELFGSELREQLATRRSLAPVEELQNEFKIRFPHGEVLDVRSGRIAVGRQRLTPVHLRQILREIKQLSSGVLPRERQATGLNISVYAPEGEPRLIFVINKEDAGDASAWRRLVQTAGLRDSYQFTGIIAL